MTENKLDFDPASNLRRRAEEEVKVDEARSTKSLSPEDTRRLLHELRVHQIELEMQNEELRRAQAELDASRERYFDLYDLAPVGYLTLSEKGLILEANLTAATLFGVAKGSLVKQPLSRFILPEDKDIYYRFRKRLSETHAPQVCEVRMLRADAAPFWTYLDATAAQDASGAPTCRVVASDIAERKRAQEALEQARDELERHVEERTAELSVANQQLRSEIEERKQAEVSLRASEEKFRVAFEDAAVGMVIVIDDLIIARANASFACMTGYSQEELVGKSILDITASKDRERTRLMVGQIMAGEISHFRIEKRYLGKGGRSFWGQSTVAAVHGPDGKVVFTLDIIEDITARKQAEEALLGERQTMSHLLQASDQDRQTIAYEIHDELAQQLAGAIMQFQTFEAMKDTKPRVAMKAYHEGMALLRRGHSETRRLIAGVRPPILDEAGVVAAIGHLVHEQILTPGPKIEYRSRVRFERLAPTLENSIYRVAQEGLRNACQYSKSEKVRISLLQQDNRVRIEIRDWGIGFNVKATAENRFGLEGIRQRARLLGGDCRIRSATGKGTCVTVELPLVECDFVPCIAAIDSETC